MCYKKIIDAETWKMVQETVQGKIRALDSGDLKKKQILDE